MPQLLSQADVRPARQLLFCYLCGKPFTSRRDKAGHRELVASALTINLARQLNHPLCFIPPPDMSDSRSPADLSNELLAEAQFALARSLTRPAVINSYQAVETLANAVFKDKRKLQLLATGMPEADADKAAEGERKEHRTKAWFLLHRGLKEACGRSLWDEEKTKYDQFLKFQELRNQVAHAGYKPFASQADLGHVLCCEVLQWLCRVGGFPVRPLLPENKDVSPGLQTMGGDANVLSPIALEFLRKLSCLVRAFYNLDLVLRQPVQFVEPPDAAGALVDFFGVFVRAVGDVPIAMPVEEVSISAQQE